MSVVLNENQLGIQKNFCSGDLIYYKENEGKKRYGIVAQVEEIDKGIKIWAYWKEGDEKCFESGNAVDIWGSGWMYEQDCYLANKNLVANWDNLPDCYYN